MSTFDYEKPQSDPFDYDPFDMQRQEAFRQRARDTIAFAPVPEKAEAAAALSRLAERHDGVFFAYLGRIRDIYTVLRAGALEGIPPLASGKAFDAAVQIEHCYQLSLNGVGAKLRAEDRE